jgi:hypothetical protein
MEKFNARVSGLVFILALALIGIVLVYPTFAGRVSDETLNNMALTALGAVIVVVSKGSDWFMRGRVTSPSGDTDAPLGENTTVTIPNPPSPPVVVETNPPRPPQP